MTRETEHILREDKKMPVQLSSAQEIEGETRPTERSEQVTNGGIVQIGKKQAKVESPIAQRDDNCIDPETQRHIKCRPIRHRWPSLGKQGCSGKTDAPRALWEWRKKSSTEDMERLQI